MLQLECGKWGLAASFQLPSPCTAPQQGGSCTYAAARELGEVHTHMHALSLACIAGATQLTLNQVVLAYGLLKVPSQCARM